MHLNLNELPIVSQKRSLRQERKRSAATRDRTRDLTIFSRTLSQLSYCGMLTISVAILFLNSRQHPKLTSAQQRLLRELSRDFAHLQDRRVHADNLILLQTINHNQNN